MKDAKNSNPMVQAGGAAITREVCWPAIRCWPSGEFVLPGFGKPSESMILLRPANANSDIAFHGEHHSWALKTCTSSYLQNYPFFCRRRMHSNNSRPPDESAKHDFGFFQR